MEKTNAKRKIVFQIIMVVFIGLILISTVFAWFVTGSKSHNVIFTTGNLEVEAILYQANDSDFDGIFDESDYEEKTSDILIENAMSNQIYSFKLVIRNHSTIKGNLTVTLKDILFLDENNTADMTFSEAFDLKHTILDGDDYNIINTPFPTNDYIIATKSDFDFANVNNEVVLKFQIVVNKNLTNSHFGYTFSISTIEVKLEQTT